MFLQKSILPLFGAFYPHFAIRSALRAAGASRYPAPQEREWPRSLSWRRSGPNRVLPDQPRVNLAALRTVKLLPAFLTRLIDKSCAIRMSGGQVSSCQWAYTRAPPFGVGDTRACFSHRIAKDGRHDPDIPSLRQCRAMLRSRTLIGATFFFNHRPLERSHLPEGVGKPAAQLLIDQPHPHWLNILGFNRFQRPRAGYRSDDIKNLHRRAMGTVRTVTWKTQDLNHARMIETPLAEPPTLQHLGHRVDTRVFLCVLA